jgi:hypothetical protein
MDRTWRIISRAQFSQIMVRASKLTRSLNTARSPFSPADTALYILYQFNEVKWRRPERQLKKPDT